MRKKTIKSMVLSFVLICASSISAFSAQGEAAKGTAPVVAVGQQSKRLAVFLDGTWNAVDDNTNVWRMKALCAPTSADGKAQLVYYEIGVNGFMAVCLRQG
jgi:uncharacterized protein (DUF2235 family)